MKKFTQTSPSALLLHQLGGVHGWGCQGLPGSLQQTPSLLSGSCVPLLQSNCKEAVDMDVNHAGDLLGLTVPQLQAHLGQQGPPVWCSPALYNLASHQVLTPSAQLRGVAQPGRHQHRGLSGQQGPPASPSQLALYSSAVHLHYLLAGGTGQVHLDLNPGSIPSTVWWQGTILCLPGSLQQT